MPVLTKGVSALANRMPKVISPRTHAIIDYANAGSFILVGALLLHKNKRAAISSWICGGATLANVLMTDMPGGVWSKISLPTHLKIDGGLAATCAALPKLMGFTDDRAKWWFRSQAIALTSVGAMTNTEGWEQTRRRARAA